MLAAEVTAVELIVAIHPTAQNHQFPFREHLGMVVFGVLRMRGIGQQGTQRAPGTPQAAGRQIRPIVIAPVSLEKRGEFGNDGTG